MRIVSSFLYQPMEDNIAHVENMWVQSRLIEKVGSWYLLYVEVQPHSNVLVTVYTSRNDKTTR
jgi:hypothetical protein